MQKNLFCHGYWRQLVILVAASLAIPTVIHAANLEPDPVLEAAIATEPVTEAKAVSQPASTNSMHSESAPALNTQVCAPTGIAIDGFDLVSYYNADAPQAGLKTIYAEHLGLTYQFANTQNRAAFLVDPSKYLPNYRGWCSTNLSMGRLACPDYTNYKLEDGKLLFFERVGFTNGLDIWNSDPLLHRRQANQNFALLSTQQ